jgi:hypothetical protein
MIETCTTDECLTGLGDKDYDNQNMYNQNFNNSSSPYFSEDEAGI